MSLAPCWSGHRSLLWDQQPAYVQFRSHRGLRGSLHQLRLLCLGLAVVRAAARAAVAAVLLLGVEQPGEGAVRVRPLGLVQLGAAARAVQDLGLPGVQELLPHSRTRLRPEQRDTIFSFLISPHYPPEYLCDSEDGQRGEGGEGDGPAQHVAPGGVGVLGRDSVITRSRYFEVQTGNHSEQTDDCCEQTDNSCEQTGNCYKQTDNSCEQTGDSR